MAIIPALAAIAPIALKAIFSFIDGHFPDETSKQEAKLKAVQMAQNGQFKELELYLNDVASARARQAAVKDSVPSILAGAVTIGFFTILIMIMKGMIANGMENVVNIMLGSLGTAWISIIGYYFGSSSGSKEKDAHMLAMVQKVPDWRDPDK